MTARRIAGRSPPWTHLPERPTEPGAIVLRLCGEVGGQLRRINPAPPGHLTGVRLGRAREPAGEHVIDLVLDQLADLRPVGERPRRRQGAVDAHFLAQPPAGGGGRFLTGPRMPAACVTPQTGGVVLPGSPLLQQNAPGTVEHEHRKRPVQEPSPVSVELLGDADLAIALVDEDDLVYFARSRYVPLRGSTRTLSPSLRKSGTWIITPLFSLAGLVLPVLVAVRMTGAVSAIVYSPTAGS